MADVRIKGAAVFFPRIREPIMQPSKWLRMSLLVVCAAGQAEYVYNAPKVPFSLSSPSYPEPSPPTTAYLPPAPPSPLPPVLSPHTPLPTPAYVPPPPPFPLPPPPTTPELPVARVSTSAPTYLLPYGQGGQQAATSASATPLANALEIIGPAGPGTSGVNYAAVSDVVADSAPDIVTYKYSAGYLAPTRNCPAPAFGDLVPVPSYSASEPSYSTPAFDNLVPVPSYSTPGSTYPADRPGPRYLSSVSRLSYPAPTPDLAPASQPDYLPPSG